MIDEAYINKLKDYIFSKTGKSYFGRIKPTTTDFMVSCPFHKDGQERKPSCGIKRFTDNKSVEGTVHCFSCGYTTNIQGMLKYVLNNLYDQTEVDLLFNLSNMEFRSMIKVNTKDLFEIPDKQSYISKSLVNKYKQYIPYLKQRRINELTADKYCLGYDSVNNHLIFPIRNKLGKCIAFGRRSIEMKRYIYPEGFKKPLYGIYELPEKISSLFVVEGPFNLWSLSGWGKNGIALLGTGTEPQYKELINILCDNYVLALDPDDAGIKGTYKLGNFLTQYNKQVYVCLIPEGKDVNDLTIDEFLCIQVVPFKVWLRIFNSKIDTLITSI